MTFSRPGSTIVFTVPVYGGTEHLIRDFLEPIGWKGRFSTGRGRSGVGRGYTVR
jgi:O-acetylhomoserine/O-acetylserine sulfhydrylase-like pyridoxal-dependent enzyme